MTMTILAPVRTVLAATRRHGVQALLMGGQACIVYGASEFSRDVDLAIFAGPDNLSRLNAALEDLQAHVAAVPPFTEAFLARGHAVHFRCAAAADMRLDVMSVMRGVPRFEECWKRRSVFALEGVGDVDILGLEDLVAAKKTRRDKDWPMIRRLVDVHYRDFADAPTHQRIAFWLRELRTPETLLDLVGRVPEVAKRMAGQREPISTALSVVAGRGSLSALRMSLAAEEDRERAVDDLYWQPLLQELESLRHAHRRDGAPPPEFGGPVR